MFETWKLEFGISRIRVQGFVAKFGSECTNPKRKEPPQNANSACEKSNLFKWFPGFVGSPQKDLEDTNVFLKL